MENKEICESTVNKVYGDENLKEILTELIEEKFIEEIKNVQN